MPSGSGQGAGDDGMRVIQGEDLLAGSDHEFLVTLYTSVLNRWPDEEGYRHYLGRIEGNAAERRAVVEEVATSEEARRVGVSVRFGDDPPLGPAPAVEPPPAAVSAEAVSPTPPVPPPAGLAQEIAALRREMDLLRVATATATSIRAEAAPEGRLERVEAALEALRADVEALHRYAAGALKRQLADYVNDLLSVERAHLENRLRLVEKRLLEDGNQGAR
ncbi:hypothetical protein GCM10010964_26880 [Caldovatus sediminis]|uniref:DUF4214 domain-containing protein n=1 Tax=Caldovatus sediminis TaxID=2041189 RepID=A0A8J2ZCS6_9PROT|nr:DUF4214 domain-containing protein [Caldovatus sediminis]GGG37671.1 hypothetical protein GCM10010964_26880 [Caldovatus sediminis]